LPPSFDEQIPEQKPSSALVVKPKNRSPRNAQMKSFQFTVFAAENGYRVRIKYGEEECVWPDIYKTLAGDGETQLS
jgi:hypothetical protein